MTFLFKAKLPSIVCGSMLLAFQVTADAKDYAVELNQADSWELLTYSNIPANEVSFSDKGVRVEVKQSASPLIFPTPEALLVNEIKVDLEIKGDVNLQGIPQGDKGADDFVFRLGLVHEGDQTLNFMQRAIAASWIKKLYSMAPEGAGISNIQFYNVYSDANLANKTREHPLTDLMIEHFVAARPEDGKLSFSFNSKVDKPVLALWISIDGDDTKSSYEVLIKNIQLKLR